MANQYRLILAFSSLPHDRLAGRKGGPSSARPLPHRLVAQATDGLASRLVATGVARLRLRFSRPGGAWSAHDVAHCEEYRPSTRRSLTAAVAPEAPRPISSRMTRNAPRLVSGSPRS